MIDGIAQGISIYCGCQYPSEYIKQWNVKCRQGSDNNSDVIVTAQLMPTNMYPAALLMDTMSTWISSNNAFIINVDGSAIIVDKDCKVQMDHPYGTDCVEGAQASSSSALSGNNNDDDDDDDNSAGAAVGGVIAGLVIICITIVVLVIVVMLLRRREKR